LPFICNFKGIPYDELIRRIVVSAVMRAGLPVTTALGTRIAA
jgi:hypothetical protein